MGLSVLEWLADWRRKRREKRLQQRAALKKGRSNLGKERRRQEQRIFAGRVDDRAHFQEALRLLPRHDLGLVINVFGQAGVGKSSLMRQFRAAAEEAGAVVTLVDEQSEDLLTALAHMAEQLEQQGYDARPFLDRYRRYQDQQAKLEADPEAHSLLTTMAGTAGRAAVILARRVPIVGVPMDFVDEEAAGKASQAFASFVARKVHNNDDRRLILEPDRVLSPHLLEVLRRVAERQPVVMLFDTYERTSKYLDEWLRLMLDEHYGTVPDRLLIAIAGQRELDPNLWAPLLHLIARRPLEPFTEDEARDYLQRRGISDDRIIREYIDASYRLPLLLDLLATSNPTEPGQMAAFSGTAVDRFLQSIEAPLREVALDGALPRRLNQDVIAVLVEPETAKERFNWLQTMPFVVRRERAWAYHDVVRNHMLRYLRDQAPSEWREQHGRLAEFFERHGSGHQRWQPSAALNGGRGRDQLEALYHRLCQEPWEHRGAVLDGFLTGFQPHQARSRRWAETVQQAGADAGVEEVKALGMSLVQLCQIVDDEDDEEAIEAFTDLLRNEQLGTRARAAALDWRGYFHYLAGHFQAALDDLDEAIRLAPQEAEFLIDRGAVLKMLGQEEQAIDDLDRALELAGGDVRALSLRADSYQLLGRYQEALTDLEEALRHSPEDSRLLTMRAWTYVFLGRLDEGLQEADRLLEARPDDLGVLVLRVQAQRLKRDPAGIIEATNALAAQLEAQIQTAVEMITSLPAEAAEHRLSAWAAATGVDPSTAIRLSNRAREDPASVAALLRAEIAALQAVASLQRQDLEAALQAWDAALQMDPGNVTYLQFRAQTLLLLNRGAEAMADLDQAVAVKSESWELRVARASLRNLLGDAQAALADADEAVTLAPDKPQPRVLRAQLYLLLGRFEDALPDIERATELDPTDTRVAALRFEMFRRQGDTASAAAVLTELADRAEVVVQRVRRELRGTPDALTRKQITAWTAATGDDASSVSGWLDVVRDDPRPRPGCSEPRPPRPGRTRPARPVTPNERSQN